MKLGEVLISLRMKAEPSALFRSWRAGMRDTTPRSASVSLRKKNPKPNGDPYFDCEDVWPTERKRADLSLSEICEMLRPEEIASFRDLHNILFDWLSKGEAPVLDRSLPAFVIYATAEGDAEGTLTGFESLPANEMLTAVELGPVFLQDRPRVPMVRWLPDIKSNVASEARNSLVNFAQSLEPGQHEALLRMMARVESLFERKAVYRRQALTARAKAVMGHEANEWLNADRNRGPAIRCVHDDWLYEEVHRALDAKEKASAKKKDGSIRSWRAP
jgi:hypothetical protein